MKVTDPVCQMTFDADKAVAQVEHAAKTYYFCSAACREAFVAKPATYVGGGSRGPSGQHH